MFIEVRWINLPPVDCFCGRRGLLKTYIYVDWNYGLRRLCHGYNNSHSPLKCVWLCGFESHCCSKLHNPNSKFQITLNQIIYILNFKSHSKWKKKKYAKCILFCSSHCYKHLEKRNTEFGIEMRKLWSFEVCKMNNQNTNFKPH